MEELSKNYDSEALEPRILDKWLTGGYYARRPGVGDCTVTIPPPRFIISEWRVAPPLLSACHTCDRVSRFL